MDKRYCSLTGETPSSLVVDDGQDVQLWCPGNSDNRWWKDDKRVVFHGVVQPTYEDRMSFNDSTGVLTINEANVDDSGVYWCGGFDELYQIHLVVRGKSWR